ncbi:predicted protein [Histoplasma capsulatum H143]|uniref:Uncharacterized protein n=1 Tax=Ajellomyces capsulatus (strain H143) TaxID=544712 RepID=C6HGZ5_AJECH|nr:predicted protein [Histoplasma capsulatum H143]
MARCLFSKYCDLSDGGGETAGMLSSSVMTASGSWHDYAKGMQGFEGEDDGVGDGYLFLRLEMNEEIKVSYVKGYADSADAVEDLPRQRESGVSEFKKQLMGDESMSLS